MSELQLAAYVALLHRYTGQDEVAVALLGPDPEGGNPGPHYLRCDLSGSPSFAELLARIQAAPRSTEPGDSDLLLLISADAEPTVQYRAGHPGAEIAAGLLSHLETLLAAALANPDLAIDRLPLAGPAERTQVLEDWNRTEADFAADRCIHEEFEAQAARTPAAEAVIGENGRLTFRELNERANRLAAYLRRLGAGPDAPVGLFMERSPEMVVALLAILKAGGAYVPLDPTYPPDRLGWIMADAGLALVVTHEAVRSLLPDTAAQIVCMDADGDADRIARESAANLPVCTGPDHLAYVIYTSGSTGRPKGVLIEHRSVLNLAAGLNRAVYDRHPGTHRVSLNAPLVFDASVQQWQALLSGHALCVVPQAVRQDAAAMVEFLRRHRVTVLDCTPSHLRLMLEAGLLQAGEPAPAAVLVGGEAIDEALWQRLAAAPGTAFYNVYGPTECTVDATSCQVTTGARRPVIGRPMANRFACIVDRGFNLLPAGVPGELCIGGTGLARGYLGRPDLTAERFLPNPFGSGRLYRTGDLARYLPDGSIEYLGRVDHQVKIRGYRVELGEIEAVLCSHPGVREAVVTVWEEQPGDQRLVAYLTRTEPGPGPGELRRFLSGALPPYMVPSRMICLEAMPLNASGKVDRRSLPAPTVADAEPDEGYVAPRTPEEIALAAIWGEVLRLPRVGVADNFFALGGHSLLAGRVIARVREQFRVELPIHEFFAGPTIAQMAVSVAKGQRSELSAIPVASSHEADLLNRIDELSDAELDRLLALEFPEGGESA